MSLVGEFGCLDLFAGLLDLYMVLDKLPENGIRSYQSFSSVRTMFNPLKIIHYLLNTEKILLLQFWYMWMIYLSLAMIYLRLKVSNLCCIRNSPLKIWGI